MTEINTLIHRLPQGEMSFGGSHGGQVYQNYPWPPLDLLPAKRNNTAERLAFISFNCRLFPWTGLSVLDIGCANGAMSIGFALQGANVTGWDWNGADLDVARAAAKELEVNVKFQEKDIIQGISEGRWDIIAFLSVWKWIAWRYGVEKACQVISDISQHCDMLIFESGLTGTGIDLVQVSPNSMFAMLKERTGFSNIDRVGFFPRDDQQVDRAVWVCS